MDNSASSIKLKKVNMSNKTVAFIKIKSQKEKILHFIEGYSHLSVTAEELAHAISINKIGGAILYLEESEDKDGIKKYGPGAFYDIKFENIKNSTCIYRLSEMEGVAIYMPVPEFLSVLKNGQFPNAEIQKQVNFTITSIVENLVRYENNVRLITDYAVSGTKIKSIYSYEIIISNE